MANRGRPRFFFVTKSSRSRDALGGYDPVSDTLTSTFVAVPAPQRYATARLVAWMAFGGGCDTRAEGEHVSLETTGRARISTRSNARLSRTAHDSTMSGELRLTSSGNARLAHGVRRAQVVEHALERLPLDRWWRDVCGIRDRRTRADQLAVLPMFCPVRDVCTRPAATCPNIACRSFFRTSSVSSTSLSAIPLNASPSC